MTEVYRNGNFKVTTREHKYWNVQKPVTLYKLKLGEFQIAETMVQPKNFRTFIRAKCKAMADRKRNAIMRHKKHINTLETEITMLESNMEGLEV